MFSISEVFWATHSRAVARRISSSWVICQRLWDVTRMCSIMTRQKTQWAKRCGPGTLNSGYHLCLSPEGMAEVETRVVQALKARLRGCPSRATVGSDNPVGMCPTAARPHATGRDPRVSRHAARVHVKGRRGRGGPPGVCTSAQRRLLLQHHPRPPVARPVFHPKGAVSAVTIRLWLFLLALPNSYDDCIIHSFPQKM